MLGAIPELDLQIGRSNARRPLSKGRESAGPVQSGIFQSAPGIGSCRANVIPPIKERRLKRIGSGVESIMSEAPPSLHRGSQHSPRRAPPVWGQDGCASAVRLGPSLGELRHGPPTARCSKVNVNRLTSRATCNGWGYGRGSWRTARPAVTFYWRESSRVATPKRGLFAHRAAIPGPFLLSDDASPSGCNE